MKDKIIKSNKLNLGCEKEYKNGWLNVDFDRRVRADAYVDLNKFPWPWKDDSFDEILASAIIEHLDDFYKVMRELHRIGKQGCKIYILLPHASEIANSFAEVEHKWTYSYHTFGSIWANKELWHLFRVLKRRVSFTRINFQFMNKIMNPLVNLFPFVWERCFSGIVPCGVVVFILEVRKDKKYQDFRKKELEDYEKNYSKFDNLKFIKEV